MKKEGKKKMKKLEKFKEKAMFSIPFIVSIFAYANRVYADVVTEVQGGGEIQSSKLGQGLLNMVKDITVKLRVMNGDGARWKKNITAKGAISQKDNFHIHQEIVRDIQDKKCREELEKIIEEKRFNEVEKYIENLKFELG